MNESEVPTAAPGRPRRLVGRLLVAALLLGAAAGAFHFVHRHVRARLALAAAHAPLPDYQGIYRSDWKAAQPGYLEDQRALAKLGLFHSDGHSDAGPWLNPILPWRIPSGADRLRRALEHFRAGPGGQGARVLQIPEALHAQLEQLGHQFILHARDVGDAGVDLAWMAQLAGFDRWSYLWDSLLAEIELKSPDDASFGWSLPDLDAAQMHELVKLRLMRGQREGKFDEAAREVRQLARLLATAPSLSVALLAPRLLRDELQAREALADARQPAPAPPEQLDAETLQRIERTILNVPVTPWLPVEELASLARSGDLGLCAAITDSLPAAVFSRPLLEQRYPAYYAWMGAQIAQGGPCHLQWAKRYWALWDVGVPARYYEEAIVDGSAGDAPLGSAALQSDLRAREYWGELFLCTATRAISGPNQPLPLRTFKERFNSR
jgi:hypothetical protein